MSSASRISLKVGAGPWKGGKKGKYPPLNPTDVIPVYLDVETAKTLLTALALALSNPINKKKKKKSKKKSDKLNGGKTGKGII